MDIPNIVAALITEDADVVGKFYASVACVEHNGRWLLGLSKSDDSRKGLWCFPGGGIKPGETPEQAAVRECREEMGVACKPVGRHFMMPGKPGVAFVYCKAVGNPIIIHNHEFSDSGMFSVKEMASLKLFPNVLSLIRRC